MTELDIICWKCGGVVADLLLPLSRTEECGHCGADLHVCRMCRFYDTAVGNACREPVADFVSDKTRANFCGYLEVVADAGTDPREKGPEDGEDDLNALFGLDTDGREPDRSSSPLDDLFGLNDGTDP